MSVNVARTAHEMLQDLQKNGFNKVRVLRMEYEGVWNEHYAIFVLQFDEYYQDDFFRKNDYQETVFHYEDFRKDFKSHLVKLFPGCEIIYQDGCKEYEIISRGYREWLTKHADALEEFSDKNWDEHKRLRRKEPVIFTP